MTMSNPIEESLIELQKELVATLAEKMDALRASWQVLKRRLEEGEWEAETAEDLARQTHNLRGEAALFGLSRLVPLTRELESVFKRSLESAEIAPDGRKKVEETLRKLREACELYVARHLPDLPEGFSAVPIDAAPAEQPLIYVVEDDAASSVVLEQQLVQYGFEVACFDDLDKLEKALESRRPGVLVMDIMLREGTLAGVEYISKLRCREESRLPVVFVSARDDMVARLQACRAGGNAYFTKPLRFNLLAERLDQLTGRQPNRPYEILIVDDDPVQAEYYSQALEQAGMSVSILERPMGVLGHLNRHRPDLILLDLYMPKCSGPEIAAVLQQHESYLSIPIVFLSAEDDFDQQLEALGLGGEDFLTKPIEPKHLIATIRPRAERGRALGSQIHRDGLTGLATHGGQKVQLELELNRADREGHEVSFAMVDLDDFKAVNDEHGHAVGDRVLCALATVLKRRLRRTDLIARYGGDEFSVVFPNTRAEDARRILTEVSEGFSSLVHVAGDKKFSSTISCGIASFPQWPSAMELTAVADRALYQAKRQGRNRVVVS